MAQEILEKAPLQHTKFIELQRGYTGCYTVHWKSWRDLLNN